MSQVGRSGKPGKEGRSLVPTNHQVDITDTWRWWRSGVVVQELLESKTKTLTGSWEADMCGGSHLHPDWRKNPKFSLKVSQPVQLIIGIMFVAHIHV